MSLLYVLKHEKNWKVPQLQISCSLELQPPERAPVLRASPPTSLWFSAGGAHILGQWGLCGPRLSSPVMTLPLMPGKDVPTAPSSLWRSQVGSAGKGQAIYQGLRGTYSGVEESPQSPHWPRLCALLLQQRTRGRSAVRLAAQGPSLSAVLQCRNRLSLIWSCGTFHFYHALTQCSKEVT